MTPKSLLRHKICVSNLDDFSKKNSFHRILEDHAFEKKNGFLELEKSKNINKEVMCSGKIYFDLLEAREKYWIKKYQAVKPKGVEVIEHALNLK